MWTIIGLVLMAVGFIGVLVGAKMQKTNPNGQPVAILSAAAMILGLVLYGYFYMFGSDNNMEAAIIYQCSIMDRAGDYLKKAAPGKKVVFVVEPGMDKTENGKKLLEAQKKAFEKAYGGSCEVVELSVAELNEEDGGSFADAMKVEDFEKMVAENESADVFVITVGLPNGDQVPDFKGKIVFLTNSGMVDTAALKSAIEEGTITAVVTGSGKKIDPNFEPDEDELKEAFDTRWIIVDKSNLDKLK